MISPELLDYEPQSVYFRKRWGAALAWVEEKKKHGRLGNSRGIGDGRGRKQVPGNVERQAEGQKEQGTPVSMRGGVSAVEAQVF
jgi:hypothetical protein